MEDSKKTKKTRKRRNPSKAHILAARYADAVLECGAVPRPPAQRRLFMQQGVILFERVGQNPRLWEEYIYEFWCDAVDEAGKWKKPRPVKFGSYLRKRLKDRRLPKLEIQAEHLGSVTAIEIPSKDTGGASA